MLSEIHFATPFSFEKSAHIIKAIARSYDGEHPVFAAVEEGRFQDVLDMTVDYANESYLSASAIRQVQALVSKNAMFDFGIDLDEVALHTFLTCERKCLHTNARFTGASRRCLDAGLVYRVQRKIASIIGTFPGLEHLLGGFGPGASVGVSRLTSVRRKLSTPPTVTTDCSKFLPELRALLPAWHWLFRPKICDVGKLQFVPKNATTKRPIVVEPLVNTYLQKGVGEYFRGCLLNHGVDLRDQGVNQELARIGSLDGSWATLDLRSASDMIARCVIAELLPYDWWYYLDSIRTPAVLLPDKRELCLKKFSSMGNGYTFELESLVFYAIASVICESRVNVYGDDLVVPSHKAQEVVDGLLMFGFEVNTSKSFIDGPFRESCGRDFLRGIDIRPLYVKDRLSVRELFRIHNFYQRNYDHARARLVVNYIPRRFRIYGPDGFGDGHLISTNLRSPVTLKPKGRRRGWAGYTFQTYQQDPHIVFGTLSGDMAARLYKAERRPSIDISRCLRRQARWTDPIGSGNLLTEPDPPKAFFAERGEEQYRLVEVYTLNS